MKKLIFTALAFATLFNVGNAQNMPTPQLGKALGNPTSKIKGSFNKATVSGWYQSEVIAKASNVGGGLQPSILLTKSDSLYKAINNDGSLDFGGWFSTFGGVLDPKDEVLSLSTTPELVLTRYSRYTLDSIAFVYQYVRNVDSVIDPATSQKVGVVDTLFITYFKHPQITRNSLQGSGTRIAFFSYNAARKFPSNFTKTDTFLLTQNNPYLDTTTVANNNGGFENGWFSKVATFPAPSNFSVNANEISGFACTFKSGVKAVLNNDTAVVVYQKDPSTFTGRRSNYFGGYLWVNEKTGGTPWDNKIYYNTSLVQPMNNAYGQAGGWQGDYIPGSAFTANDLFLDYSMHLTSLNASTQELANEVFGMGNVYPNPTAYGSSATVSFDLKKNGTVSVNVYSITGQLVKTIAPKNVTVGTHTQELDLAGLKAGIYLVNMTVNGVSETRKLTITE